MIVQYDCITFLSKLYSITMQIFFIFQLKPITNEVCILLHEYLVIGIHWTVSGILYNAKCRKNLFYVYCPIRMSMISNCQWIQLLLELIHYIKPSYRFSKLFILYFVLHLCIKLYHSKSWNETYTFVKNDKKIVKKFELDIELLMPSDYQNGQK